MNIVRSKGLGLTLLVVNMLIISSVVYFFIWSKRTEMLSMKFLWMDYVTIFTEFDRIVTIVSITIFIILGVSIFTANKWLRGINILIALVSLTLLWQINMNPW